MSKKKAKKKQLPNAGSFKPILKLDQVREKLAELNGNQAAVARTFGVTRQAVSLLVHKHLELRTVIQDAIQSRIDTAESALDRAILNGEFAAIKFFLETRGKDRGYTSKTEIEHSGKVNSQPTEIVVKTREEADALLGRKRKSQPEDS